MGTLGYAWEKLYNATLCLASGLGTIQERLEAAYLSFHSLDEDDFPDPELGRRFAEVVTTLSREPAVGDEGSVHATLARMGDPEARDLAREIVSLFDSVAELYYQSRKR